MEPPLAAAQSRPPASRTYRGIDLDEPQPGKTDPTIHTHDNVIASDWVKLQRSTARLPRISILTSFNRSITDADDWIRGGDAWRLCFADGIAQEAEVLFDLRPGTVEFQLHDTRHGHFSRIFDAQGELGRMLMMFYIPDTLVRSDAGQGLKNPWFVVLIYNIATQRTIGLFHGAEKETEEELLQMVKCNATLLMHPLFMPLLVLNLFTLRTVRMGLLFGAEIIDVEGHLGTQRWSETRDPWSLARAGNIKEYEVLTKKTCRLLNGLIYTERRLYMAESILKEVIRWEDSLNKKWPSEEVMRTEAVWVEYEEAIHNLRIIIENRCHQTKCHLKRGDVLMTMITKLIDYTNALKSVQIAEDMKRDSKLLKMIGFLGMFFLPATAVSAFLSSGSFDVGQSGIHITSLFWLFWVITAPLTVAVLMLWSWWMNQNEPSKTHTSKDEDKFSAGNLSYP